MEKSGEEILNLLIAPSRNVGQPFIRTCNDLLNNNKEYLEYIFNEYDENLEEITNEILQTGRYLRNISGTSRPKYLQKIRKQQQYQEDKHGFSVGGNRKPDLLLNSFIHGNTFYKDGTGGKKIRRSRKGRKGRKVKKSRKNKRKTKRR